MLWLPIWVLLISFLQVTIVRWAFCIFDLDGS